MKHGHSTNYGRTPTYQAWENMKNRCYNKNYHSYSSYGGRGITVSAYGTKNDIKQSLYYGEDFFEACCVRKSWENKTRVT